VLSQMYKLENGLLCGRSSRDFVWWRYIYAFDVSL